jgi:hypothetical protein
MAEDMNYNEAVDCQQDSLLQVMEVMAIRLELPERKTLDWVERVAEKEGPNQRLAQAIVRLIPFLSFTRVELSVRI